MKVEVESPTRFTLVFPVPTPGILNRFAVDYGQPFQPKHFLAPMHAKYNPKADEEAKAASDSLDAEVRFPPDPEATVERAGEIDLDVLLDTVTDAKRRRLLEQARREREADS